MYALISPNEKIKDTDGNILGSRVAQISDNPFPVAEPLHWVEYFDTLPEGILYFTDHQRINGYVYPIIDPGSLQKSIQEIEL